MRLGQLSRKLDIKPAVIRDFIRNEFKIEIDPDLNTRIEDTHAAAISAKFEKKPEPVSEEKKTVPEKAEAVTTSEIIEESENVSEPAAEKPRLHIPIEVPHYHEAKHQSENNNETAVTKDADEQKNAEEHVEGVTNGGSDGLSSYAKATEDNGGKDELSSYAKATEDDGGKDELPSYANASEGEDKFIPLPVDPDAELIRVPKIKLEGLKVVGKIELPQEKKSADKTTEEEKTEITGETVVNDNSEFTAITDELNTETKGKNINPAKTERKPKSASVQNNDDEEFSIFKDKRGIYHFSQTQRENRKNSLERIKREKQEELRKQKKIKHYQQLVEAEKKPESSKAKAKKQAQKESKRQPEKPQPKGIWGKFMRWLND